MHEPARADPRSQLLALQRSAGNQAVIGLLRETATEPPPIALFAGDAHKEIHEALDGFNDVPRAMTALKGHDDGQRAQIKKAFEDEYHVKLADYLYDQLDGADLVRAFALLESSHLNDPATALGLALIPIGTRDEEILRVLEGSKLDGRKKIEEAYDEAFGAKARPGGLMKGSLRADLEDDLSGWRKEKAITLLDRELTRADHLYFVSVAIAGTHDDSVIAIVQEAWDAGPAEFATLEADWTAHYKPADLRTAMREELSLEAWLLVKAVLDASDRLKKGELSEDAPKELKDADRQKWLEQDARLAAAKSSAKAATTGEDAWYEGAGTNEEQLDKAIETIRTVWQERIDKAVLEKRDADAADYRKKQGDAANDLHLGDELSGVDLQKAKLLTSGALTDADEVYLASRDLDTEKVVSLVTKAWAAGKMDQLLADAAKERSDAGGVRPSFTVNMTLPIGGTQWDRVNWVSRADHDDATRGANRLGMELDEGNSGSDLAKAVALLTAAKPELRARTVAKFAELRKLPGEGDPDTRLLDYVDRRYEKVEEAVALRDLLQPAKTAQEQYDRAKARMEASKTGLADELLADWIRDYDTISGEQTQAVTAESLERLKFLAQQASAKDVAKIAAQRGIKGPDALGQIAKMEYGDFKTRLAEAEAVEGAIVEALATTLELVVSAALTAATGGAAGGLLVASLSSAVAGMLAREALMGDKYDLLSKENAQKIAGIVAGASFGALAGELMQGAQSLEKMGRVGVFVQEATQEAFSQIGTTTIGLAFDEKAPSVERIAAGAMNMLVGTVAAGSAGSIRFKLEDAAPFAEQLRVRFAASMTAGTMNMLSEQGGEILKQGGMRDMTGPELLGQVGQKGFEAAKAAMIQSLGEIGAASKRVADEQRAADEEAKAEGGEDGKKAADEEAGELNAPGGRKPGPHEPHLEDWPEGLVHYGLDEAGAEQSYRASVDTDPSREAAIWFDPSTGERLVVQGGEAFVSGSWLNEPEFKGRPWRIVEHFHPGDADVAKFASPADFRAMMMSQLHGHEEPVAVKSDIRYKDAQGREHVTEFGYDPEFGYWLGMKDEHGQWDVKFYDDEPWSNDSKYRDFLAEKGLATQPARAGGGGVESAAASQSPEAVRERVADVRRKYADGYGGPEFEKHLADIEKKAAKRPEEAAAKLAAFVAELERHERGMGQPDVYDPGDEDAQPLDERDKPGGKLPTTDPRRPSTQLAERMEKIYGPRPEGHDAHHIVAESDPRGGLARKILLAVGINVNDGINGAYLPGVRGDIVREGDLKHGNVHTNAYYQEITVRLAMSDDIPATLREIHNELLSNKDGLGIKSKDTFPEWAEKHRDTLRSRNIGDADIDDLIEATTRR